LAHANTHHSTGSSKQERQHYGAEESLRDSEWGMGTPVADSQSLRVQGLRTSGEQEPSPHGKEKLSVRESKGREQTLWDAEPNVGRVVDGCANRVDRIRLLGNGVVPQTSAKAWQVLNEELAKNE
jgi:DNA (cytosine-5)-methyltransferase 1